MVDLTKRILQAEDDLISCRDNHEFDFKNMKQDELQLLYDCLGTLEMNSVAFRKKIRVRLDYMREHGYSR